MIAGAAVFGLIAAAIAYFEATGKLAPNAFAFGPRWFPAVANSNIVAVVVFGLLCLALYRVARQPMPE